MAKSDLNKDMPREALRMPHVEAGMRVGLFGGSFNPAHNGHKLVSDTVLSRLALDQIWWIVTPGNPLKDAAELAPLSDRLAQCKQVADHPKVKITAFEANTPSRFTADMLANVMKRNPEVNFVWTMGADNLLDFHQWQNWQWIAHNIPICVVDRPGSTLSHLGAPASIYLKSFQIDESQAVTLPGRPTPCWTFLHGPRSAQSSTKLRQK